jgi:hypothetical protein
MGEGLYVDRGGLTVFCDPLDGCERDDFASETRWRSELETLWDDFTLELTQSCIAPPWRRLEADRWLPWPHRDVRVLAESGLHQLTLFQDSYARAHVTVRVRDDLETVRALAERALDASARRVFRRLAKVHPLRVRDTAWTSRHYDPESGRAAT